MQYKLDLNLQQRAILRIAISFWERQEVKDKTAEFFRSHDSFSIYRANTEWGEFTKSVVDDWNKDVLPKDLADELIHIVKMIGETIFNWFQYIKHEYKEEEAINCIKEIQWTPYGTVDVVKIFKSSLLTNPNLDITKVYSFACRYAISDHINELWDKIPPHIQFREYNNCYRTLNQHILAYWIHCRRDDLPNLIRDLEVDSDDYNEDVYTLLYDLNRSVDENMLRLTVYQGHFVAMKYFWERLTEEERDQSVLKCARIAVLRWNHYKGVYRSTSGYKMSQYVETCVFLIKQMSEREKKSFYNEDFYLALGLSNGNQFDVKNKILTMLLFKWPWEELFFPVLEDVLHYVDDDSKMGCQFLDTITGRMCKDHEFGYSLETSKYPFLLRKVWLMIPALFKREIPQVNPSFRFIYDLIHVGDLVSLNLIINDPEIAAVRDQFIDFGCTSYEEFVVNNQFEKLDYLIEMVFKFEEEQKKSFKQKINPWRDIFKDYNFYLADKFLDWQSSTPEERQTCKNNIDHMTLCMEFIDNCEYEILDEFLDWKFETILERISCEEHFKNDLFAIRRVYDIWSDNPGDEEQISSRFLDWVFESNEEIKYFKKETLVNFHINESIIDDLVEMKKDGTIYDFLSWCSLNDTQIYQIKQELSERNEWWN